MITADINYATQFITTEEHTLLIDHNFVDSPVEHFRKLFGSSRFNTWAKVGLIFHGNLHYSHSTEL